MMHNEAQAAVSQILLNPASAANTAAATSGWVDVRAATGDLLFVIQTGARTGTITWAVQHASDGSGTGAATIVPNEGAPTASAANSVLKVTVSANAVAGWVRVVGTIVTGPAVVSASVSYRPETF